MQRITQHQKTALDTFLCEPRSGWCLLRHGCCARCSCSLSKVIVYVVCHLCSLAKVIVCVCVLCVIIAWPR